MCTVSFQKVGSVFCSKRRLLPGIATTHETATFYSAVAPLFGGTQKRRPHKSVLFRASYDGAPTVAGHLSVRKKAQHPQRRRRRVCLSSHVGAGDAFLVNSAQFTVPFRPQSSRYDLQRIRGPILEFFSTHLLGRIRNFHLLARRHRKG